MHAHRRVRALERHFLRINPLASPASQGCIGAARYERTHARLGSAQD
ncbi:hypothetical protein GLE_1545 [Lysobacter enzymogenes]|uniref:Lipoprotein n=1 Tax=Lysobacter enzymogenes TaxID=69 RepID=A0A0S2DE48_LYSEN|nr:hypothetical protein GLE_1545 [Lysobacter enzymogenes]